MENISARRAHVTPPPVSTEGRVQPPTQLKLATSVRVQLAIKGLTVKWTLMNVLKVRVKIYDIEHVNVLKLQFNAL